MVAENLAGISTALSTTFSARMRRQWNGTAVTAATIEMESAIGQGGRKADRLGGGVLGRLRRELRGGLGHRREPIRDGPDPAGCPSVRDVPIGLPALEPRDQGGPGEHRQRGGARAHHGGAPRRVYRQDGEQGER